MPGTGNNSRALGDNGAAAFRLILNSGTDWRTCWGMKRQMLFPLVLGCAVLLSGTADAACFADYKAKQDSPLRLHYGVAEVPDSACGSRKAAAQALAPRLEQQGWTLLNVVSIFGPEGLDQRKDSAGQYFLRY